MDISIIVMIIHIIVKFHKHIIGADHIQGI